MGEWDALQYLKFEEDRTQPAADLLNRINTENPQKIIDIGCGPGNSTALLAGRFPDSYIIGIDNSEKMIEQASADYPSLLFSLCDAGKDLSSAGKDYDIVFSNACIQWIPDHHKLIKNMFALLKKGGVLAVQMPMNQDEQFYRIIDKAADDEKWGLRGKKLELNETLSPPEYHDILSGLSDDFSVWETTYYHRMSSCENLAEWAKGSRLRPYLEALSPQKAEMFVNEIVKTAETAYSAQTNGEIVFRFRRFFFLIQR